MRSVSIGHRSGRKRQTRLDFDLVEPSSSVTMSSPRVQLHKSGVQSKVFDFSSPAQTAGGVENETSPSVETNERLVLQWIPPKEVRDRMLSVQSLATPAASSQPESGIENGRVHLNASKTDSRMELAPSSPRRQATLTEWLGPSQVEIPISPRQSDPIFPSSAVSSVKPTPRRRLRLGFDGAYDDSSAGSALEDEIPTPQWSELPQLSESRSQTPASLAVTTSDIEMEDAPRTPTPTEAERERAMTPVEISSDSPETIAVPKKLTARSSIAGGWTYKTPAKTKALKKSRKLGVGAISSGKRTKERTISSSSGDDTPVRRTSRRAIQKRSKEVANDTDDSGNTGEFPEISRITASSGRNRRAADHTASSMQGCEDLEDQDDAMCISAMSGHEVSADEDDDCPIVLSSVRKRRCTVEEDDDCLLVLPPRKRRYTIVREDDSVVASSPTRNRRSTIIGEHSDGRSIAPSKRLRRASGEQVRRTSQQDQRNTTTIEDERPRRRTRAARGKKAHRTEKEKNLELMRRRRAGQKIDKVTSSESEDDSQDDSGFEMAALSEFDDEDPDEVVERTGQRVNSDHDSIVDDDNFVVDDDRDASGDLHPGMFGVDAPLQFTRHAHKPMKDHFQDAVEWMVQNKINPAFDREEAVYLQAFKRLNGEINALVQSKFISSSWSGEFVRALRARPKFIVHMANMDESNKDRTCEACGRSNHAGQYFVTFGGKAYYNETLEQVQETSDHEGQSDGQCSAQSDEQSDGQSDVQSDGQSDGQSSDGLSINSQGMPIPHENTKWWIGSFCRSNAETAHGLIHWKYELNKSVLAELRGEGHLNPAKLTQREGWSQMRRDNYGTRIIKKWHGDGNGKLRKLYDEYKTRLNTARNKKMGRWDVN